MAFHNYISQLEVDPGEDLFYDSSFIQVLYNNKDYISKNHSQPIVIDPHMAYVYEGDLFGLLSKLGVNKQYHLATLIINGYSSPTDFKPSTLQLIIPDPIQLGIIKGVYSTRQFN